MSNTEAKQKWTSSPGWQRVPAEGCRHAIKIDCGICHAEEFERDMEKPSKCGIIVGKEYSCIAYDVWVVTVHRVEGELIAYSWIDNIFKTLQANTMNLNEFKNRFEVKV